MKRKAVPVREFMKFEPYTLTTDLRTDHSVLFEDNVVVDLNYKEIIIMRYIFIVIEKYPELKIVSDYNIQNYYVNGLFSKGTINKLYRHIFKDLVHYILEPQNRIDELDNIFKSMYIALNRIYNEVVYSNIEYASTINILDLLDIQFKPDMLDAMNKVKVEKSVDSINNAYKTLDKIFKTDESIQDNNVTKAYLSGMVNANQIKQVLGPRGYGTEIDNKVYKTPIVSSFTMGMQNIYEMAVESRSGAKALYLSTNAVRTAEYFARELQLMTMAVEKIEFTDCGNKDYINWYVNEDSGTGKSDLHTLQGKYYLNEETGKEEVIKLTDTHLIGKTIKLRSVVNCKLKNKYHVCSKCYGELAYSIFPHFSVGHISTTTLTEKITQSILSTKHLVASANTSDIVLDTTTAKFFTVKDKTSIAFKPEVIKNNNEVYIIISQDQCFGIKDIKRSDISKLDPSRISRISTFLLKIKVGDKFELFPIHINQGNRYGNFTVNFLEYIINSDYILDDQDRYVIPLDKFKSTAAIIRLPQVEFSFLEYAREIKKLLKSISVLKKSYSKETPESILQKLYTLVNTKLTINISVLEIIIYSMMIKSLVPRNFDLARGADDPQIIGFKDIIANRSLGAAYGWERVVNILLSPTAFDTSYIVNHPLDVLLCPNEVLTDKYGSIVN